MTLEPEQQQQHEPDQSFAVPLPPTGWGLVAIDRKGNVLSGAADALEHLNRQGLAAMSSDGQTFLLPSATRQFWSHACTSAPGVRRIVEPVCWRHATVVNWTHEDPDTLQVWIALEDSAFVDLVDPAWLSLLDRLEATSASHTNGLRIAA